MADTIGKAVNRLALATVAMTFLLIIAGALVTSRDAGLAVPDWPLSFGTVNPPRWYAIENVRTEHGHRVIAGAVALLTLALAFVIRRRETDPSVRRLGLLAAALVLLQAALGGLRVLHLSVDLAMVHGWLGQAFFCVVVSIFTLTSPAYRTCRADISSGTAATGLLAAFVAAVIVQLIVGILIRHQGADARPLLSSALFYVHLAVAGTVLWTALRVGKTLTRGGSRVDRTLIDRYRVLVTLVWVQLTLGVGAFAVTETMAYDRQATFLESWLPTAHVAVGAALLGTSINLLLLARAARSAEAPATAPHADLVEAR